MAEVGIRELRDHLSKYLEEVQQGNDVVVTDRGRAIATVDVTAADAGRATVTLPRLSRGIHLLTASYAGDDESKGSSTVWPSIVLVW